MSKIANQVKTSQDKDGMLRRALERIIQLYTDKSHFVYELLQNAEDADAKSILFHQCPDRLEVFHDGRPFTSSNLQRLCDIGISDKVGDLNKIGEFGVGFKSVFGICETVRLYSAPDHFRVADIGDAVPFAVEIRDFVQPEDIPEEPMPAEYTTRFVFPFSVGHSFSGFSTLNALVSTLSQKLQNLGITTLLFMKNLEQIEYQIDFGGEPIRGTYLLEKKEINDHCVLVSALGTSERKGNEQNNDEVISYLKFSRGIGKYAQRTVDIAYPIKVENGTYQCIKATNPFVSVYFPTETESKLDFIVQGPYRTTPNRSSIPADDEDNIYLAKETAALFRESILELKNTGKLNMSFLKSFPFSEDRFRNYKLFLPLYSAVKELFQIAAVIPSKSGEYVPAKFAKIARTEKLPTVFPDNVLTELIHDGKPYCWLPTFLTETNREYESVFRFLSRELKIQVVAPDDLRTYFAANPQFLPKRSDDWLVEFYGIMENIPAAFSKNRDGAMLTSCIVKTSRGEFVAPFRREGKTYIPNVFLPSEKIKSVDINFVDQSVYKRCRTFFDEVLQLQKPNEYEFIIKDIAKRYGSGKSIDESQHIDDINALVKYSRNDDYRDEVTRIIKDVLCLRCKDGSMRSAFSTRIFLPVSDGINIEEYYRNLAVKVYFIDADFYESNGIGVNLLTELGVQNSLLIGMSTTTGTYETGLRGKQPDWWTSGDFKWKLSMDAITFVLRYISAHPSSKDSIWKSQAIMKVLLANEPCLCGLLHINGSTPNRENEPCELIHILRGEKMLGWDGKWLFTESGELVAPKSISKHDLSTSYYGKLKPDSIVYELLGFKKTTADEVDDLKKQVSKEKLDAYFESELRRRYNISSADLNERYGGSSRYIEEYEDIPLPFPKLDVKNWDTLRKHAAEMLIFAAPVIYEERVRSIRVSNRPKEAKAYLKNMYRHDGTFKYACQLCHDTCGDFEATEIFLNPETELDPINLCLCPNCATVYRRIRTDSRVMDRFRKAFLTMRDTDIQAGEHVALAIDDDDELWFTQTHFAEIQELFKLLEDIKTKPDEKPAQPADEDKNEKSGLSVYSSYIGKTIRRKDGFAAVVKSVDGGFIIAHVTEGKDAGKDTKISLSFVLKNKGVYSVSDN